MPSELIKKLWNCEIDNYKQCKHSALQKFVDFIKNTYFDINKYLDIREASQTCTLPQTERFRDVIDIHLKRRIVGHLMNKVYGVSM